MDLVEVREWLSRRVAPPPDPGLDVFRDAVGMLGLDGVVVGYVASRVSTFWGLGRPPACQGELRPAVQSKSA